MPLRKSLVIFYYKMYMYIYNFPFVIDVKCLGFIEIEKSKFSGRFFFNSDHTYQSLRSIEIPPKNRARSFLPFLSLIG